MTDFLSALGLAIFIAGLIYAAVPEQMKTWLAKFNAMPVNRIRFISLGVAVVGLVVLFLARA